MNKTNREIISYIFFGVLTTIVSIGAFALFDMVLGIHELIANVISWIFAVAFAYATNRKWVFSSKARRVREVIREAASFTGGRLLTLAIEESFLLIFITWLGFNDMIIKILGQIFVMVSNFVISKWFVFR